MQLKISKCILDLKSYIESLLGCKYNSTMLLNLINDMMDMAKSEKINFDFHD